MGKFCVTGERSTCAAQSRLCGCTRMRAAHVTSRSVAASRQSRDASVVPRPRSSPHAPTPSRVNNNTNTPQCARATYDTPAAWLRHFGVFSSHFDVLILIVDSVRVTPIKNKKINKRVFLVPFFL